MPVYKDNKGKWYIKYKNQTKRGFLTKKEAEKFEAKMKLEETENNCNCSFDTIAKDYLSYKKTTVSYGTYNKYKTAYDDVISKLLPVNTKAKDIDKMDCRKFCEKLRDSDYSTEHKNYIITLLKSIFKHGVLYFNLKENPSTAIERCKKTYDELLKDKEKEMNIWTVEEFNKFIAEIDNPVYKTLFIVLYYTGMRLGEALALKWKDYENGRFDIYKSITYKTEKNLYEEKQPKNSNSIRKISVGNNVASIIMNYKKEEEKIPGFKESWYMFGRNRPLPTTSIDRYKNKACETAKVKRIRIHDLRHSHASYLISMGVNIVAVSRRLGHSDVNMTLKVYTHLFKNKEDEITEILDNSSQNLLKE